VSAVALVELRGLRVRLPGPQGAIEALRGVDLELGAGERLVLVGESGSGKSTLLLAVAGLLPEEAGLAGAVRFPSLGRRPVPGLELGLVLQDPFASLHPMLTVGEQIAEVLVTHRGQGWRAARTAAIGLMERVGIARPERRVDEYPHRFSGGQRQRIAIAMAVAAGPRLLLADEPTSALDTVVQAQILELLLGLVREQGMALLLVTHDLALAARSADRIAVLYAGRIVEAGPAGELLRRARHPYTQALVATARDLGRVGGGPLTEIRGLPPDPAAALAGCPFAPRCTHALPRCSDRPPTWSGDGRSGVACHLVPA
jgi:oligopeptide/dipeptide ABC transporter ATP-binding protein